MITSQLLQLNTQLYQLLKFSTGLSQKNQYVVNVIYTSESYNVTILVSEKNGLLVLDYFFLFPRKKKA